MQVTIGRVDEFPPGRMRIVTAAGRSVGVYNTGAELLAVLNVCPHQLAPVCEGTVGGTLLPSRPGELVYGLDRNVIRCPWHGWEFDLRTGKALFRAERRHLNSVPVSVVDEVVVLEVKNARPAATS